MKPFRIFLADDHTMMRAGLRALLEELGGLEVVGEAGTGRETLAGVEEHRPDLLLLDIAMPEMTGLEALAELRKQYRDLLVIILSMHANEEHVLRALELGANGYLLKQSAPDELEAAINAVREGKIWFSSELNEKALEAYRSRIKPSHPEVELTERQREVLKLLASGLNAKQIGVLLNISSKTVDTYRSQLQERLGYHDVANLVRYAIRMGIVVD